MITSHEAQGGRSFQLPIPVVCPECKGDLRLEGEGVACANCGREFKFEGNYLDLVIGDRFDDPTDDEQLRYEEKANAFSTRHYWVPMFNRLFDKSGEAPKILSLGCGTGTDVDQLCDEGFNCVGIDCGNRTRSWPRRTRPERFLLANGMSLPFAERSFDAVYCGCVFPHLGVEGDTSRVTSRYREDRLRMAAEMTRVLKPGGKIVVASPNRNFPLDIFHGRTPGSYRPRLNLPTDPFLLSVRDYRNLFLDSGCASARAQPVQNYWGFLRSTRSLKGRVLGAQVRLLFWLASQPALKPLWGSPISPWIVVLVEKAGRT